MKYNLKNRPKNDMEDWDAENRHSMACDDWFEGFERELREMLEDEENYGVTRLYNALKEILGE